MRRVVVAQKRPQVRAPPSVESSIPARRCTCVPGSQIADPEYADVPPSTPVFSRTSVRSPADAAASAPAIAPAPEPATTTSYSSSHRAFAT